MIWKYLKSARITTVVALAVLSLSMSACSSLSLSDLSTGAGAIGATAALDAVAPGAGTATKVVVTAIGATAGAALIEDTAKQLGADVVKEITNPWQAAAVAFNNLLNHAFEIVIAIGIALVGIPMVVSFVIGKVIPRRKEKDTMSENEMLKKLIKENMEK